VKRRETHKTVKTVCDFQNNEHKKTLVSVRKMGEDTPKVECVLRLTHDDGDHGSANCVVVF